MTQEHKPLSSKNSMKFVENVVPNAEGVTRPKKDKETQRYNFIVKGVGNAPMKLSTYAESKEKAIKYVKKRWSDCSIRFIK